MAPNADHAQEICCGVESHNASASPTHNRLVGAVLALTLLWVAANVMDTVYSVHANGVVARRDPEQYVGVSNPGAATVVELNALRDSVRGVARGPWLVSIDDDSIKTYVMIQLAYMWYPDRVDVVIGGVEFTDLRDYRAVISVSADPGLEEAIWRPAVRVGRRTVFIRQEP